MKLSDLKALVVIGLLLIFQSMISQDTKQEKESSIKIEQFPGKIPARFHNLDIDLKREKFYKQQDGKDISYEMKFRHNRYDYSVEVDTLGKLIDIEIKVKKKKIPQGLIKEIEHHFDENFDRFKIEKIQAQFRKNDQPTQKLIENLIKKPLTSPDSYEIIVAVKDDGSFKRFEYLFDTFGQVEKKRKVIRNEFDYLIF
jgi:hypothetical protein